MLLVESKKPKDDNTPSLLKFNYDGHHHQHGSGGQGETMRKSRTTQQLFSKKRILINKKMNLNIN